MGETFGTRLKQFAFSVDVVDEGVLNQVWELIRDYLRRELNLAYWALLVEGEVDGKPGLRARDSKDGSKPSFSLKTGKGQYNGLAAFAFGESKPLWLTTQRKEPFSPDVPLRDDWSKAENLPRFDRSASDGIRTAIMLPLRWQGRTQGVLDLQFSEYQELTQVATTELEHIGATITEMLVLSDTNQTQRKHTGEAVEMLRAALQAGAWPSLSKPQIFVAYSAQADPEVIKCIRSALDAFTDRVRPYYWEDSNQSGNIGWEILKQVKASRFALCYFSEPAQTSETGAHRYQDNANVLFEAGMFQALTNPAATDQPTGWIPIRESQELSSPPPFDFAQQRMIIPERAPAGGLDAEKLRTDLKARIEGLLT